MFLSKTFYFRRVTTTTWAGVAQAVQCLATDWTTGRSRFDSQHRPRIFPLTSVSWPALGPTQPPVQWVPGVLSPGAKRGRGVTLTTRPHLVLTLRMSRSYTFSPPSTFMACSGTYLAYLSTTSTGAPAPCDSWLRTCWSARWSSGDGGTGEWPAAVATEDHSDEQRRRWFSDGTARAYSHLLTTWISTQFTGLGVFMLLHIWRHW
jgi:hypothetical protein